MPKTNRWLCVYAIAQLGRPYWYGTSGQIATDSLYSSCVAANGYYYADYASQLGQKVHDCSGLIGGALTCEGINDPPTLPNPLKNQYSMFNADCSTHSNSMNDFPYIPGTLVFTSNGASKTHVGIYVGDFIDLDGDKHTNSVVEAMGHNWGVTTSSIDSNRWDSWGQLDCCEIDTTKGMVIDARASTAHINVEVNRPFVATLSESYGKSLDYTKIKAAKISAMMFFGGELYDMGHNKVTYINKHLAILTQECTDAGLPFALYVNVRANNEIEADAECRALYYILSEYPPKLGIWLSLQTNNTIDTNDRILEVYYRYITQWGIGARCGLYLTKSQLNKITWVSFQERFYLWLIDNMPVTEVDDELLQPEMFEVAD